MNREYILCSAIYFDDKKEYIHMPKNIETGFVICGRRHHNCFAILGQVLQKDKGYKNIEEVQGFLTSENRFVDRQEAGKIAFEAGQTDSLITTLFSENLW